MYLPLVAGDPLDAMKVSAGHDGDGAPPGLYDTGQSAMMATEHVSGHDGDGDPLGAMRATAGHDGDGDPWDSTTQGIRT